MAGFTTILDYTTLKRQGVSSIVPLRFTTILDYTTLKLDFPDVSKDDCFTTILDYTTLKHALMGSSSAIGFTTILDYTTLKHKELQDQSDRSFTTILDYTTKPAGSRNSHVQMRQTSFPHGFPPSCRSRDSPSPRRNTFPFTGGCLKASTSMRASSAIIT